MEIGTKVNWSLKNKILFILIVGFLYGITNYFLDVVIDNKAETPTKYIFMGLFFSVIMLIFFIYLINKSYKKISATIKPNFLNTETIKIEGPASIRHGKVSNGGKLFITDERLIFKPHKINVNCKETIINLTDIKSVGKCKIAKFFNNGISFSLSDNTSINFVVNDREIWIKNINQIIEKFK